MVESEKLVPLLGKSLIKDICMLVIHYLEVVPGLVYDKTITLHETWERYPRLQCRHLVPYQESVVLFKSFDGGTLIQQFDFQNGYLQRQKVHHDNIHESRQYQPCSNGRLIVTNVVSYSPLPVLVSIDDIWEEKDFILLKEEIPFHEYVSDVVECKSGKIVSSSKAIFLCDAEYNFQKSLFQRDSMFSGIDSSVAIENKDGETVIYATFNDILIPGLGEESRLLEVSDSGTRVLTTVGGGVLLRNIHFSHNHLFMMQGNVVVCYSVLGKRIKLSRDIQCDTFSIKDDIMYIFVNNKSQVQIFQITYFLH